MLKEKIENKSAKVGIIGLGYVGLPLAIQFANSNFEVIGFDVQKNKVEKINKGKSPIIDIKDEEIQKVIDEKKFRATINFQTLSEVDAIIICVPTPLNKTKDPDVSFVIRACKEIKKYLRKDQVVVLESTTYPGFTKEVVLPILEESKLMAGRDFYLAFSPERIDPANKQWTVKNTPKIIGGYTQKCAEIASMLYSKAIDKVFPVSSMDTAEMTKLLENTFRAVNIALVNEVSLMCHKLNIDVWEVIEAATTKPFGFMPFYPGPGIGGHCIPIDPLYLSWKLRIFNYQARFIELADAINSSMPGFVVNLIADSLNKNGRCLKGSKILISGVSYKKDIEDVRESPAIEIIELLSEKGADVMYHDPYVEKLKINNRIMKSESIKNGYGEYDCVAIITDHSSVDYEKMVRESRIVVDTRNATAKIQNGKTNIYKL